MAINHRYSRSPGLTPWGIEQGYPAWREDYLRSIDQNMATMWAVSLAEFHHLDFQRTPKGALVEEGNRSILFTAYEYPRKGWVPVAAFSEDKGNMRVGLTWELTDGLQGLDCKGWLAGDYDTMEGLIGTSYDGD